MALAAGLAATLTACHPYTVTINDHPVYVPPALFDDYRIPDPALRDCVAQTIADRQVTAPDQLTRLICTHGEIADVAGLEVFVGLAELDLSHNNLTHIKAILQLPRLETIKLAANDRLDCGEARLLATNVGAIELPAHCAKK